MGMARIDRALIVASRNRSGIDVTFLAVIRSRSTG
jgi:hypothetical protein